jgi:hypothetical protein
MSSSHATENNVDTGRHIPKTGIQKGALAFGIAFVLIGVLGFFPFLSTNTSILGDNTAGTDGNMEGMGHSYLLGLFMVNTVHNLIHIASGAAALAVYNKLRGSRLYFQVLSVVYGLVTIVGLITGSFFGLMDINTADNLLHIVITAGAIYFGFIRKIRTVA